MPIAYLTTPGMHVALRGERLELEYPPEAEIAAEAPTHLPLAMLEHLVVDVTVRVSLPALAALAERDIPVLIVRHGGKVVGQLTPVDAPTHWLERQIDVSRDAGRRAELARAYVRAKVRNQRRLLQRFAAARHEPAPEAVAAAGALADDMPCETDVDRLRGLEGAAAAAYFRDLAAYFPEAVPLERRSYHPPHNAANALLSYLYTLLVGEISLRLRGHGLHPAYGFFHLREAKRPALALDLAEPFRPIVGDALALDLLNHGRVRATDFEPDAAGRILMGREARRVVTRAFEERMLRRFYSEHLGHETCLRLVLDVEIDGLKAALAGERPVSPFESN